MDDKNKKELGYSADIQYKEDYYSEHEYSERTGQLGTISDYDDLMDDDFMDIIQNNINDLIYLVPNLPVKLQTAINQLPAGEYTIKYIISYKDKEIYKSRTVALR
jgi:hypothetical protein